MISAGDIVPTIFDKAIRLIRSKPFGENQPNSPLTVIGQKFRLRSSSEAFHFQHFRTDHWRGPNRLHFFRGKIHPVVSFSDLGLKFPTLENRHGHDQVKKPKANLKTTKEIKKLLWKFLTLGQFQHIDMLATSLQEMYEEKLLLEKNSKTQGIPDDGVFNPEVSSTVRMTVSGMRRLLNSPSDGPDSRPFRRETFGSHLPAIFANPRSKIWVE